MVQKTVHLILIGLWFISTLLAGCQWPTAPATSPPILAPSTVPQQPNPIRQFGRAQPGIWIASTELAVLPTSGPAWENLLAAAQPPVNAPTLGNKNDNTNVQVLAQALLFARTGEVAYGQAVADALRTIAQTPSERAVDGSTLALGCELAAYVIAADLINLPRYDAHLDTQFRGRLRALLHTELKGSGSAKTLRETHELRPNNWGTHAGASRVAIAVYLGDEAELARAAQVFKGWLGDHSTYAGFKYHQELSWQCDPARPVGINPVNCVRDGHKIGGALPEELRRSGAFAWPPQPTDYAWEALQGALLQATILTRAGYNAWTWEEQALLRAVQFLHDIGWTAQGDDEWQPWLVNCVYGTAFPASSPARPGKNIGWTDWTHGPAQTMICAR